MSEIEAVAQFLRTISGNRNPAGGHTRTGSIQGWQKGETKDSLSRLVGKFHTAHRKGQLCDQGSLPCEPVLHIGDHLLELGFGGCPAAEPLKFEAVNLSCVLANAARYPI